MTSEDRTKTVVAVKVELSITATIEQWPNGVVLVALGSGERVSPRAVGLTEQWCRDRLEREVRNG